jgi:hypothetical protein
MTHLVVALVAWFTSGYLTGYTARRRRLSEPSHDVPPTGQF